MSRKEWLEVGRQCLYFVLLIAGIALLIGAIDRVQGWSFESEKFIIMLGLWLLTASMFLGLSPFALDARQKGMEYLLTLPIPRRRLLFIKLLPRLAALAVFFFLFLFLYSAFGNDVFGNMLFFLVLAYFALFFISFSLASAHENFIVQFILAAVAFIFYWLLCLWALGQGFAWTNNLSLTMVWKAVGYGGLFDWPGARAAALAVFSLMLAPFIISYFQAFKKFDLRRSPAFNRRQLLLFAPLLMLALALSLGISRLVQGSMMAGGGVYHLTADQRLVEVSWNGRISIHDAAGRRRTALPRNSFMCQILCERQGCLYLIAEDVVDDTLAVIRLRLDDLSRKEIFRFPRRYFAGNRFPSVRCCGGNLFLLQRRSRPPKSDRLDLVVVDLSGGKARSISFRSPHLLGYYSPMIFASDRLEGREFWLLGGKDRRILRLWEDGRLDDLGPARGLPAYYGHLLFSPGDGVLAIRRLTAGGSETLKELAGDFRIYNFTNALDCGGLKEIYAFRGRQLVRLTLDTFAVMVLGPERGYLRFLEPGVFYYVEGRSWARGKPDPWRNVYRLQDGRMLLLKRFDFSAPHGGIWVEEHGIIYWEKGIPRCFAFPGLQELRFKNLN
jgi:hypothetical protein